VKNRSGSDDNANHEEPSTTNEAYQTQDGEHAVYPKVKVVDFVAMFSDRISPYAFH
jgi:hypothetical protein